MPVTTSPGLAAALASDQPLSSTSPLTAWLVGAQGEEGVRVLGSVRAASAEGGLTGDAGKVEGSFECMDVQRRGWSISG